MMRYGALLRTSALVTLFNVIGLGAGFLLQLLLANAYGATAMTDAYLAAATIPTLINTVFLTSLNITFVPVFVEYAVRSDEKEAWKVAGSFILLVGLVLSVLALLGIFLSQPLIALIAPGLTRTPETWHLAADLQRILLPSTVFMALGGLIAGIYYAREQFLLPSLGPLVAHGTAFGLALLLIDRLGVHGVAWGVLCGAVVQLFFLLWPLRARAGDLLQISWGHPGVAKIGRLMVPWLLAAAIYKANPVVDRIIASHFAAGAISILGYAYMIIQLATVVASKGVSITVFPALSRLSSENRPADLTRTIDTGLRMVATVAVPLLVVLALDGEAVARVLFERGAFTPEDSVQTGLAILGYLGAFVALSAGNVTSYVFYALQDTKTPAIVGCVGMGVNLALALLLRNYLGFLAPAVSFSVMGVLNVTVMALLLHRRLGRVVNAGFSSYVARTALAGGFMALAWLAVSGVAAANPLSPLSYLLFHAAIGGLVFCAAWALLNRPLAGAALARLRYHLQQ